MTFGCGKYIDRAEPIPLDATIYTSVIVNAFDKSLPVVSLFNVDETGARQGGITDIYLELRVWRQALGILDKVTEFTEFEEIPSGMKILIHHQTNQFRAFGLIPFGPSVIFHTTEFIFLEKDGIRSLTESEYDYHGILRRNRSLKPYMITTFCERTLASK